MVEIGTERLLRCGWRDEDLESYARMCAGPEVMRYMGREQSEEQVARFIHHWEEYGLGLWAIEERSSGAFVGRIGLMRHDDWPEGEHKTEVGWLLDRAFWGRGLAMEGVLASVRHGFDRLGLERTISIIQPANTASRRVAEKAGLTLQASP